MDLKRIIRDYLDYCRYRKELDPKTLKAYGIDLKQYSGAVRRLEPERREIEQYLTELHKKYRQKTIKRKTSSLQVFFSYLEEMEYIGENPLKGIRLSFREEKQLPRIIPRQVIERLFNELYRALKMASGNERKMILRDAAVMEVLFATGARVTEVSGITLDTIDMDTGIIRISGKGRKERCVQIGEEKVLKLLREYYESNKKAIDSGRFFFVNRNGDRFQDYSIRRMIKKYTGKAGILHNITPHMFWHSLATYLIEEDVDISCVQQILGHSSLKTTEIYLHISMNKQAEVMKTRHPRKKLQIRDDI